MKPGDRPTKAQRSTADLWLIRRDGTTGAADEASFQQWLIDDPRHEIAWREASVLWDRLEQPAVRVAARDSWRSTVRASKRSAMRRWLALPAGVAMATLLVWIVNPSILEDWQADVVTARGEVVSRDLPDGSRMRIGADTALDLDFTGGARRVAIRRGQAFFDVKPGQDAFTVSAGGSVVRVLGTAFNVDRTEDGAEVTVQRGAVSVAGIDRDAAVRLAANQHVLVSNGRVGAVETGDLDIKLAWMTGRLVFDRVPLRRVVAALQRQTLSRIAVRGRFADQLVSGTFPTSNVDETLEAIAGTLDGNVAHLTPWLTVIY
ncbi:MAG TPA: FecR domain-containing protein [Tardiphaga sp.]